MNRNMQLFASLSRIYDNMKTRDIARFVAWTDLFNCTEIHMRAQRLLEDCHDAGNIKTELQLVNDIAFLRVRIFQIKDDYNL